MSPWILAARPKTLPLAISGILLGSAIAWLNHFIIWPVLFTGLGTAVLLQILSNYANDYGDFKHGTDVTAKRDDRMLSAGKIGIHTMKKALFLVALLSILCGLLLLYFSEIKFHYLWVIFLLLGLSGVAAALKYTIGKRSFAYSGLGDVFVFIFFGLIAVCGIFFLHSGILLSETILAAVGCGLLCAAVLNVNNLRDRESDQLSNKKTLPVRFGKKAAVRYHFVLCMLGILFIILSFIRHLQIQITQIALLEYFMVITVFSPVILLLTQHYNRIKTLSLNLVDPETDATKSYNKELKSLSLIVLLIAIIFWILAAISQ